MLGLVCPLWKIQSSQRKMLFQRCSERNNKQKKKKKRKAKKATGRSERQKESDSDVSEQESPKKIPNRIRLARADMDFPKKNLNEKK